MNGRREFVDGGTTRPVHPAGVIATMLGFLRSEEIFRDIVHLVLDLIDCRRRFADALRTDGRVLR